MVADDEGRAGPRHPDDAVDSHLPVTNDKPVIGIALYGSLELSRNHLPAVMGPRNSAAPLTELLLVCQFIEKITPRRHLPSRLRKGLCHLGPRYENPWIHTAGSQVQAGNSGLVFEDLGGLPGGGVFLLEGAGNIGQGNRGDAEERPPRTGAPRLRRCRSRSEEGFARGRVVAGWHAPNDSPW